MRERRAHRNGVTAALMWYWPNGVGDGRFCKLYKYRRKPGAIAFSLASAKYHGNIAARRRVSNSGDPTPSASRTLYRRNIEGP